LIQSFLKYIHLRSSGHQSVNSIQLYIALERSKAVDNVYSLILLVGQNVLQTIYNFNQSSLRKNPVEFTTVQAKLSELYDQVERSKGVDNVYLYMIFELLSKLNKKVQSILIFIQATEVISDETSREFQEYEIVEASRAVHKSYS